MTTPVPPPQYPDWATVASIDTISGQPNKVPPASILQSVGYQTEDIPAANNLNWLWNLQGLWIRYFGAVSTQTAPLTVTSSNGSASLMLPNDGSVVMIIAGNDVGSYALYVGYQASTAAPAALTSIGGGTIVVTPSAGGIISATDPANPSAPMTLAAISVTQ
jgi:hypothetical protein